MQEPWDRRLSPPAPLQLCTNHLPGFSRLQGDSWPIAVQGRFVFPGSSPPPPSQDRFWGLVPSGSEWKQPWQGRRVTLWGSGTSGICRAASDRFSLSERRVPRERHVPPLPTPAVSSCVLVESGRQERSKHPADVAAGEMQSAIHDSQLAKGVEVRGDLGAQL